MGRNYKVHLDSYNLMPALKGEAGLAAQGIHLLDRRRERRGAPLQQLEDFGFLKQPAHGLHVWIHPFEDLRAPMIWSTCAWIPFELARVIGMDYGRWFAEHISCSLPPALSSARWLQSFLEYPPRQKPAASTSIASWKR